MPRPPRTAAGRYGIAVAAVVASLLVRWLLQPWLGPRIPYLPFLPAILLAGWYGGLGPGVLATVLSCLGTILPPGGLAIGDTSEAVSLGFFGAMGVGISALNDQLRRTEIAQRTAAALATARAERLAAIINTSVDGIIVIDARGTIEEFNPAAERLFGYARGEIIGRPVRDLMPAPFRGEHDHFIARYLQTGEARIIGIGREVSGLRKDGTTFPLHLAVGEYTIAGERRFAGIVHDLTARVAMEEQMREQNALARLGEMSTVIAHEVRNPLAGIRGAIEVICGRLPAGSAEAAVSQEIIGRIDALNAMMKELLFFARPPRLRPGRMEIVPLIASAAEILTTDPALAGTEVSITGSVAPSSGDADLLRVAFQNVLMNSAQATHGRGRVDIHVTAHHGSCEITITDNGPGIKPEVVDKVFTPFFTTKARGSGLGLPTAKRIIEAHRGQIQLECPPSGGTKVVIRLPMEA